MCDYWINTRFGSVIVILLAVIRSVAAAQPPAVASFAGNAQHTAIYQAPSQNLNTIHWSTTIDFNTSGAQAHYGAPLITSANTVIVPVKTANNGFRVKAFDGATGGAKYTLSTDYILPGPRFDSGLSTNVSRCPFCHAVILWRGGRNRLLH